MKTLTVYNKDVIDGQYPNGLAYSVHFTIQEEPVRNDYGMLFPKGSVDEENRIVPAFVGEVRIASVVVDSRHAYLITGENWTEKGIVKSDERVFWAWLTENFITYDEWNLCAEIDARVKQNITQKELGLIWNVMKREII